MDGGSNDCNKGKQANTREGMKSAKTAFRLRLEYKPEEEMGKGSAKPFIFLLSSFIPLLFLLIADQAADCQYAHTDTHTSLYFYSY